MSRTLLSPGPAADGGHRKAPAYLPGLGMLAVLVAGDLLTGDEVALVALMAVAPLVTAISGSVRETAVVAVVAAMTGLAAGSWNGELGTAEHAVRLGVVGLVGLAAIYSAVLRVRREARLADVTAIAEVAQRAVLRPLPERVGNVRFAASYRSAQRAALIGGDLYEAVETAYGVRVVVGDVRGKGLDAVRLAAGVLGAFRLAVHSRRCLTDVARDLDGYVARDGSDEEFVTALLLEFGASTTVVDCGHHPPVVLRAGCPPMPCEIDAAPPLGLCPDPRPYELSLRQGDRVLLFTDGLVEARDHAGAFFDLPAALAGIDGLDLVGTLDTVVGRLVRHTGGRLDDDLAILVAEPLG